MPEWMALFEDINNCERCPLCAARAHAVPGEGNPFAKLMLIGEGPGAEEDRQGRPFVGASGVLLTKYLHAIGVERTQVYIANIVKCRPPGNRTPTAEEAQACLPYLRRQFLLIKPKLILLLGGTAAKYPLGGDVRVRRDHGQWVERKGTLFMTTFHPSALLRDASQKKPAWQDFMLVRDKLRELEGV